MKKILLIIFLAFNCCYNIDASNMDRTGAKKIILNLLDSAEALAKIDMNNAESLAMQAQNYADKIGFDFGIGRSKFVFGYINRINGKSDLGVIHYFEAASKLSELESLESLRLQSIVYQNIANIFHDHYKFDEAIEHYNKSIQFAENVGFNKMVVKSKYLKSKSLRSKKDFTRGMDELFDASNLALNDNNYIYLIKINHQLGMLFKDVKDYSKSRDHQFEIFKYKDNVKRFDYHAGRAYHNIANTYLEEGDSVKAGEFYQKAIASKLATGNPKNAFISYMDYAELLMLQGNLEEAQVNYDAAIATGYKVAGNPDRFKIYKQLADLSLKKKDTEAYMNYNLKYTTYLEDDVNKNRNVIETDQQYSIQLVTQRYYELIDAKRMEEQYKQWALMAAGSILFILLVYFTFTKIRAIRLRRILEHELREAMVDIKLDD